MRIAYDARGGGLGHMRRTQAILRAWLRLRPELETLIMVSGAHLAPLVADHWPLLRLPSAHEAEGRPWLQGLAPQALAASGPWDGLVVDAFPEGLLGEWGPAGAPAPKLALIARPGAQLAQGPAAWAHHGLALVPAEASPWPEALPVGAPLALGPEELWPRDRARAFLGVWDPAPLLLAPLGAEPGEALALASLLAEASEALQARGLAHHLRWLSPLPLPHWGHDPRALVHDPALELFLGADLILGGAGANLVAELGALGARALLHPRKRSHDDQLARAQGWAWLPPTPSPEAVAEAILAALAAPPPTPRWGWGGAARAAEALDAYFSGAAKA